MGTPDSGEQESGSLAPGQARSGTEPEPRSPRSGWRAAATAGLAAFIGALLLGLLFVPLSEGTVSPPAEPTATSAPVAAVMVEPTAAAAVPTAVPTATPAPPVEPIQLHTVAPGETVRSLAERYGISTQTLIAANDLPNPDLLLVGQELRIPTIDGVVHALQPAETVGQVAEHYGISLGALIEANGLGGGADLVSAGRLLIIPGVTPEPVSAPPDGAPVPAPPRRVGEAPPPTVTARYVAIVDEASGEVLHGQDEHARVAPASVTKIATTLVALEREPNLGRRIPVTISGSAMAARDGSSIMGLEPGRQVSLETLLYGMMLPSGNDAAEQVALALGGSRETYVGWMNRKAVDLGLQDTHFVNPSGMDASGHYSSAYDMALLGRAAMRNETFRQVAREATYRGDGYSLSNLNRLIGAYKGADGIKIGRTRAAGRTIVASATRDGHRIYVSLMRSQDVAADSTALFDWVWSSFEW